MNKQNLFLIGAGVLVLILIIKSNKNKKPALSEEINLPDTSSQTVPPASTDKTAEAGTTKVQEPEVVEKLEDPKISYCKDKWIKFAETRKFGSEEQTQKTYDNFMTSCFVQS